MNTSILRSPIDGRVVAERELASAEDIEKALCSAKTAQAAWKATTLPERAEYCNDAIDYFVNHKAEIAEEISLQMGRPMRYSQGEIGGLEERARYMISIADAALKDQIAEQKDGFQRFIRHEPLGLVVTIAPWNYPYLTAVNSIIPAIMAGNTVILKHSSQTLLCAERFAAAFESAGLPEGVFQYLHMDHESTSKLIEDERVNFVSFTGSVPGGERIEKSLAGGFKGLALELGGKDPAYVRADADIPFAVENVLDGAFFNSGQSCCGIERIYVHESQFEAFVAGAKTFLESYKLGDALDPEVTLGPMVSAKSADFVRDQIEEAISQGARPLIAEDFFGEDKPGTPYLAPQLLTNVDHSMRIMTEESFGPVVGVMSVSSDEEAIELMNDSDFGLTASVWTQDKEAALDIADKIETGTVFMNRCDYLDPALAWVGVKDSGRGCALSDLGYQQLTRPKSFHLRIN